MLDRLQYVKQRFDEISDLIIQPDIIADQKRYVQLNQEYKSLKALADKRNEYIVVLGNIDEANEIIADGSDADMTEMAKMQLEEAKDRLPILEDEIKFLLIPKDAEDAKNVMVEIRAGTGGDEASIFAGDLFRMYTKYCENRGWRTSVVDINEGTSGGFKEVIFEVTGEDVYGTLKFEAGVHRVQRVPQTETQGRVHTSAATVMVLPEAEEFDVQIDMNDVRVGFLFVIDGDLLKEFGRVCLLDKDIDEVALADLEFVCDFVIVVDDVPLLDLVFDNVDVLESFKIVFANCSTL